MRYYVVIIWILFSLASQAQPKKSFSQTDTLQQVTILGYKELQTASNEQKIDSTLQQFYKHTNLQHLLQLHSNVFVKNYGVSTLSTISIRGSSAAQTAVRWQGININNAMTGITDLSTIPVSLFEECSIQYGSQANNNSMSGGINLANPTPMFVKNHKASVAFGYESLHNQSIATQATISNKHIANTLKVHYLQGQNRYSFFNIDKDRQDTLTHAHQTQWGLLNDFHWRINPFHLFSIHSWVQTSKRDIPPATFENTSAKQEQTTSIRNMLEYNYAAQYPFSINSKIGLLHEQYAYQDSLIFLRTQASLLTVPFITKLEFKPHYRHTSVVELTANHARLLQPTDATLNRASLMASYSIDRFMRRFNIKATMQYEVSDVFTLPLAMSFVVNTKLHNKFQLYASASRTYRAPTLNELYYNPGGNLNLKPETGNNFEAGLTYKRYKNKLSIEAEQVAYNRNVQNWIVWYGNAILTPHNILGVHSRGLESILTLKYELKPPMYEPHDELIEVVITRSTERTARPRPSLGLNLLYAYTLSTTEASALPNDYSIGKQIPYVPRYQFKLNPTYSQAHWDIQYIMTYTGYRFITTDESQWLMPYANSNLYLAYRMPASKQHQLQATARIQNIFNADYQGIVGRTMPGRNLSLGLLYKFR
jgi:iron complex outermembrane receptor protein